MLVFDVYCKGIFWFVFVIMVIVLRGEIYSV